MRSLLFVPADSEKKLGKAASVPADALIIDLEDSVSPARKSTARVQAADFLEESGIARDRLWVRVNPMSGPWFEEDLEAVMAAAPGGIMLPKCASPRDVEALSISLGVLERDHGLANGSTKILPLVTETPAALFTLGGYAEHGERLAGLTWGAEDLGAAVGATEVRDGFGGWTPPFQMVRNLCLFAAHAADVPAIDTIHADFRDLEGLVDACAEARRDGFSGKLAIHPGQVEIINNSFQPTPDEIERAQRIVDLFEADPGAGVLELDGQMLDLPHLKNARRLLDS
jgi:citrate lyase subunit beta/citryl-CoA lyase